MTSDKSDNQKLRSLTPWRRMVLPYRPPLRAGEWKARTGLRPGLTAIDVTMPETTRRGFPSTLIINRGASGDYVCIMSDWSVVLEVLARTGESLCRKLGGEGTGVWTLKQPLTQEAVEGMQMRLTTDGKHPAFPALILIADSSRPESVFQMNCLRRDWNREADAPDSPAGLMP